MFATPPKNEFDDEEEEEFTGVAATPAPHRARLNNLESQLSELVRDKQHLEKRNKADLSKYSNEMDQVKKEMEKYKMESKMKEKELDRCKAEGDGMREEVNYQMSVQAKADLVSSIYTPLYSSRKLYLLWHRSKCKSSS
jgi:uncharacterized protein (DUF342 family)